MTRMRFFIFFTFAITVTLVFLNSATAQQMREPDTEFVAPRKAKRAIQKKIEKEPVIELNGSAVKAIQSKQPWQMVSPFAPASYGNGQTMVSEDPDELGRPQGLVLFGIQW